MEHLYKENNEIIDNKKIENELDNIINTFDFKTNEVIGEGGFGKVYKIKLDDKNMFACKTINIQDYQKKYGLGRENFMSNEINLQKSFNRPDIIKVKYHKQNENYMFIFLELCNNGSLLDLFNSKKEKYLTEKEVQCFMIQIIIALNCIHNKNIIHRDLKLSNIMLGEKNKIKIGDFGLATILNKNQKLNHSVGTELYKAPELLNNQEYSYEVDIWALGIIMSILLTGSNPFGNKKKEILENIQNKKNIKPVFRKKISPAAEDLIKQILEEDPSKRPTLNQIIYHDFFNREIEKYVTDANEDFPEDILNKNVVMNNLISIVRPMIPGDLIYDNINGINDIKKNDINDIKIYVKIYLNYNERFGVGYLLNNGDTGVYFKDDTILLLNKEQDNYFYINKDKSENFYTKDNIPEIIGKKIKILNGFIKYFENHKTEKGQENIKTEEKESAKTEEKEKTKKEDKKEKYIYAKNVIIDKKCIILKLINEVEHIFFADNVEIIMSRNENILTYIEKDKTKTNLNLNQAINNPCRELHRRIKYIQYVNIDYLSKKINKSFENQNQNYQRKETE
jgi:serine/threonine protein kinase